MASIESPGPRPGIGPSPAALAGLGALTALAAALRLWRLADVPPGFHVDEAFNVLDARAVLEGARPIFLPANAGREVLYTYLQAALMAVLGDGLAAARAASALAGSLAVPAVWWAARGLEPGGGAGRGRVAWLAAALMATTYWSLHFGRFGIRAILLAPLAALAVGAWARASTGAGRRAWSVAAGLALGAALYAHPAGRGLWLVPALHAAFRAARDRSTAPLRALAATLATLAVVAVPLVAWFAAHPGMAGGHAAEVEILSGGPAAVARNALRVAGMFNVAGDAAPWRNLPGRPVFDPVVGLAFLLGLGLLGAAAARGRDGAALTLLWLLGLLAPSVLADAAPNFSRAIGALPAACLVAAVGLERAARRWPGRRGALALLAVVAASGALAARDYFGRWATHPSTPLAFDADVRALAQAADRLAAEGHAVLLSPGTADHATVRAEARSAPRGVDAARGLLLAAAPDGGAAAVYLKAPRLPGEAAQAAALATREDRPLGPLRRAPLPGDLGYDLVATLLSVPPSARAPLARWPGLELVGIELPAEARAGQVVTTTLLWRAAGPTARPLTTALHLVGAGGRRIAQADGRPVDGHPPTDRWRGGDLIASDHALAVAPDAPPGEAELSAGWYALVGDPEAPGVEPLRTLDGRDLVVVGRLRVAPPRAARAAGGGYHRAP